VLIKALNRQNHRHFNNQKKCEVEIEWEIFLFQGQHRGCADAVLRQTTSIVRKEKPVEWANTAGLP
ncbi:MAG: hypothetical protein J7L66_03770, partial [Anaerolineaceae bacterium]|nr:hypothetical protein [Anaerolineaceae bacterium]